MSGIVARDVTHTITPRSGTLDQLLPVFVVSLAWKLGVSGRRREIAGVAVVLGSGSSQGG